MLGWVGGGGAFYEKSLSRCLASLFANVADVGRGCFYRCAALQKMADEVHSGAQRAFLPFVASRSFSESPPRGVGSKHNSGGQMEKGCCCA